MQQRQVIFLLLMLGIALPSLAHASGYGSGPYGMGPYGIETVSEASNENAGGTPAPSLEYYNAGDIYAEQEYTAIVLIIVIIIALIMLVIFHEEFKQLYIKIKEKILRRRGSHEAP